MKNVIFGLAAIIWLNSCNAQTPTDPVVPVVTIDPKCLLKTQWSLDYSFPTPKPDEYWFTTPTMNFNTETEGFFDVGLGKGKFRNNLVNNSYEVHFKYTIKGDRVIFELKKVSIFEGISLKLGEDTGQIGINTAKDLMNFVNLDNGLKLVCNGRKLTFDPSELISRVPFSVYNWKRTN